MSDQPGPDQEAKSRGGRSRAERLTPEQRSEIARQGAIARWGDTSPVAPHHGELRIGDRSFQCAVLTAVVPISRGAGALAARTFWSGSGVQATVPFATTRVRTSETRCHAWFRGVDQGVRQTGSTAPAAVRLNWLVRGVGGWFVGVVGLEDVADAWVVGVGVG